MKTLKTFFIFITTALVCMTSTAGTSVGSFNRAFQPEFDFEARYPDSWALNRMTEMTSENTVETWQLVNSPVVSNPTKQSKIEFAFIKSFPAKNAQELLAEIKKRHSSLVWNGVTNPDFVGFQSTPQQQVNGSVTNMEYYLSEAGKVVRINIVRNADGNGAAESDLILSTIRKPSLPLSVNSVKFNQPTYKPGDKACIELQVDALKAFDKPTLNLSLKGDLSYWKYRDQSFDAEKGIFQACQMMTRAMPADALHIESLSIINGTGSILCMRKNDKLICKNAKAEKVSQPFTDPAYKNDSPDQNGPEVIRFQTVPDQRAFVLEARDQSGVAFALVEFGDNSAGTKQMVLFEDELKDPQHVYIVADRLLMSGFNLIRRITFFDKIGNVTLLYANNPQQKTYQSIFQYKKSEPTGIPYVSIKK